MFDISWGELLILGGVALVVIPPKDLPRALRTLGQTTAKLKRMAFDFQSQFQDALREVEVDEIRRDLKSSLDTASSPAAREVKPDEIKVAIEGPEPAPPVAAPEPSTIADPVLPTHQPGGFDVDPPILPPLDLTAPTAADAEEAEVRPKPKRQRKPKAAVDVSPEDEASVPPVVDEPLIAPKPRKPRVRKAGTATPVDASTGDET